MKALQTHKFGTLRDLALTEVDAPAAPGPGEVIVALEAASLTLADLALANGQRFPQPALPFIPGMEGAGKITAVGKGVKAFKMGDSVAGFLPGGGLAEAAKSKAAILAPL